MSDPQNPVIPAGWHPDPAGTPRYRWWDGHQWAEHYAEPQEPAAVQAPAATAIQAPHSPGTLFVTGDPYSAKPAPTFERAPYTNAPYTTAGTPLVAPEGVPIYTNSVWFMIGITVLLPVLSLTVLSGSTVDSVMATGSNSTGSLVLSAITQLLGFLGYGAGVWLAFLDHRTLSRAGVPSPFHWAFAFIGATVYLIGRGFVMKRRTGRGMATAWIGIGIIVASFIAVVVVVVLLVDLVMQSASTF